MRKLYQLSLLLIVCCISFKSYSQKTHSTIRPWKAVVYMMATGKIKGTFYKITDSSVFVQGTNIKPDEIKLAEIKKIRLVPDYGKGGRKVVGFLVGATAGAIIVSEALSNGKSGEPATIGGVTGGIGGGLLGGVAGFFGWPALYGGIASQKFSIQHTPEFYVSLRERLEPFSIRGQ